MKIKQWFIIPSAFALSLTACNEKDNNPGQAETKTAAEQTITQSVEATTETATSTLSEEKQKTQDAYEAMGYAMAKQLGLDMGFSASEAEGIQKGIQLCLLNKDEPENFDVNIKQAQTFYAEKRKIAMAEKQAQMKITAEKNKKEAAEFFAKLTAENKNVHKTDSGLYYEIIEEGNTEEKATSANKVKINYEGKLIDGTVFDSSYKREKPAIFKVSGVVKGFGEGLQLIGKGGKIKLYIPSELGYGDNPRPNGVIEPGHTLIFTVELLDIIKRKPNSTITPPANMPSGAPTGKPPAMPQNMKTPPPPPPSSPPPAPTAASAE